MATFYIDPESAVNGSGTEGSPFNVWQSIASNNTYLQKRGTSASANVTAFGRSNVILGAYGAGANPVINGASGIAFSAANASNVTISDIDFLSTWNHAVSWNGGNTFSISNSNIIGARTGINVTSNASAVNGVTISRVVARHTSATNEQCCAFFAAQSGNTLSNVRVVNSTFSNGVSHGMQIRAGDSNSNSLITDFVIEDCNISNNGNHGVLMTSGMTSYSDAKVATNVRVLRNTIVGNGGPGAALFIRGGNSVVAYNNVSSNNTGAVTGTGGLQLSGSYGVMVYGNVCNNNRTAFAYDGVGLYLDVLSATLNDVGTEYCTIFGNFCANNNSYAPDAASVASSNLSAGIATFNSHNNIICGNVCVGNAAGVCIGSWSINNKVYNNTFINNKFGVAILWNQPSHGNVVQNNVIYGSTSHALIAPATGTRSTTGNITLSGTTGVVTCTSTAADFTTFATGYAVSAGSGYGYVVSKTSNTEVVLKVLSTFSGTSFAHGAWAITGGGDQGSWSNYNNFFANAANVYLGAGQSVVVGANSQTTDPLLDNDYRPRPGSPCIGAGVVVPGARHFGGKRLRSRPDIGAFQYQPPWRIRLSF